MLKKFENLPLRDGVGIIVINNDNKIFVAKRIDNPKTIGKCLREVSIVEKITTRQL